MRLLLDTHIWLWIKAEQEHRIPSPVRRRITQASSHLYLSAACVMEISIKHAIGKIRLDMSVRDLIDRILSQATIALPISTEHALAVGALPLHHRDPFDRALIAQAQIEGLTLVTADPRILRYDVPTIDARK